MKKQLAFFLSTLSLCALVGCNKNVEEYELTTQDSVKYLLYNGETTRSAMVVGYDSGLKGEVTIPSSINGYTVNAIRHEAFAYSGITKITIPESVKYIGFQSFSDCTTLKEVSLPNSISEIYYDTFSDCISLETINIPNSVESIGTGAFIGCENLKSISLSSNLSSLGSAVFSYCYSLNNVDFSNTKVKEISSYCFMNCSSLTNINLGNISTISSGAFSSCEELVNISLPDSLQSIGDNAFNTCTKLEKIFIPASVLYIGENVFTNNKDDFKILLGASEIPTYYSDNFNCYYPYVLGANRDTKVDDVFIKYNDLNYAINNYQGGAPTASLIYPTEEASGTITIPDTVTFQSAKTANVTSIADHAFISNEKITSLSCPTNLKTIGKYALANSSLKTITFNNAIESLDIYSFANCQNLEEINLSSLTQLKNVDDYAFYYDYNLKTVALPINSNNATLGKGAFYKCRQLNSLSNLGQISELNLKGYTFAECYNLGTISTSPFVFPANIKTLYPTDFLDWGTAQNQYIEIAKNAYTNDENNDVYLTANEGTIKLEKVDATTYKNSVYFSNAIITLEPKS